MSIVIVDYDVGNLRSVEKALQTVRAEAFISRDPEEIKSADAMVLPGVGAFAECMGNLINLGLIDTVRKFIDSGKPFLGICVGYQLLFEKSEEFGSANGLGVLKGKCLRFNFKANTNMKIPHIGWNQVRLIKQGRLFKGIKDKTDFYFVHSYYPNPIENVIVTDTEYGVRFASSIERDNVFATQFHPEKSQGAGLKVLENFSRISTG
jgi:glutamine amidotransferase